MPINSKLVWITPLVLSVALLAAPIYTAIAGGGPQPTPSTENTKPKASVDIEVKFIDDSVMKMKLLDDRLEVSTKFGVLQVPATELRRIDFASRVPAEVAEKVLLAISKLNHSNFKVREAASAELKAYRERAYPFLLKATKSEDAEVSRRADEIAKHIQARVAPALLELRENDVVQADESKISGRLTAEVLHVSTFQFGEQQLKLADVRSLRTIPSEVTEAAVVPQAPGNLSAYQQQWGKELTFSVAGFAPSAGANPSVWGTDIYTLDSNLAAAVVHAGLAKTGETVTVRVRIVHSPQQYVSTFRNNVNSASYGSYPPGAYEFVRE